MRDLLLVAAVCVFIVDVSGWTESWRGALARWARVEHPTGRLRPFDCSLCCTWWAGLVLLLCRGEFTLAGIASCALAAALTRVLLAAWNCARTGLLGLLDWLTGLLDRTFHP